MSNDTELAKQAREYVDASSRRGARGFDDCVPLASCGEPKDWLFYDPHGRTRGGEPGYVMLVDVEPRPFDDLVDVLANLEDVVRDALGTN